MKTDEIRERFLKFFEGRGHKVVSSDSLIPQNDPTLLFTGAGMNQFKDYFLGIKKDMKRAASCQKCLRTGDLENVGKTPYHHTFFEMLGNFSFGDYFKKDAIEWAWEFLTEDLRIPKDKLRVSVYEEDAEAYEYWKQIAGLDDKFIVKLGDKSNFWPSQVRTKGPNGPCGPCSEIFFDQGRKNYPCDNPDCGPECECGRFAEIWNLVFTQYDRQNDGSLIPLPSKNIDTGLGLERLACVLQGKRTNFEIDIFEPLVEFLTDAGAKKSESLVPIYTVCDHIRAAVFAIADGAYPSNEGRGYVVRKLIRRAIWKAKNMGINDPVMYKMVPVVNEVMGKAYPELKTAEENIVLTIKSEERRFFDTLEEGELILGNIIKKAKKDNKEVIKGDDVFSLYDTYGFPDELTETIAHENGLTIDRQGFERLLEKQRERAKKKSAIAESIFVSDEMKKKVAALPETKFVGYETTEVMGEVLLAELKGNQGIVVLDRTPFYGEAGGQAGDIGLIENNELCAEVVNTKKKDGLIVHEVIVKKGNVKKGDKVDAIVEEGLRNATRRNHTATHLLQSALRDVLGSHVRQLGSFVDAHRLRFDFSHPKALTKEEIRKVEELVNINILKNFPLKVEIKALDEAKKEGALAFFGEKYADKVRIVSISEISKEFCGGTHVNRTGDIGSFIVVNESSVAAGTRRIEALTGMNAMKHIDKIKEVMDKSSGLLKTSPSELPERIKALQDKFKDMEKKSKRAGASKIDIDSVVADSKLINDAGLIIHDCGEMGIAEIREIADRIKNKVKNNIIMLFSYKGGKNNILCVATKDLKSKSFDAGKAVKKLSSLIGGSGGGRKDMAQGGGKGENKISMLIEETPRVVKRLL